MHRARLTLALTAFLLFGAGAAPGQKQSTWEASMAAGVKAYNERNFPTAESAFKQALKIAEAANDGVQVGATLVNLSAVKEAQGDPRGSDALLKRAVSVLEKAAPEHPNYAAALESQGLRWFEEVLEKRGQRRWNDPNDPRVLDMQLAERAGLVHSGSAGVTAAGAIAMMEGNKKADPMEAKYNQAVDCLKRALAIREKLLGPDDPELVPHLKDLGEVYMLGFQFNDTVVTLRRAMSILIFAGKPEDAQFGLLLAILATAYRNEKKYEEAEPVFQRALSVQEAALGPDHVDLAATLLSYGAMLRKLDRKEEAKKLEDRAKGILNKKGKG